MIEIFLHLTIVDYKLKKWCCIKDTSLPNLAHSLFRVGFRQKIFGNHINYAFSEASFPMESHVLFKKIPTWYWPLVIFSNYFLSPIGDLPIMKSLFGLFWAVPQLTFVSKSHLVCYFLMFEPYKTKKIQKKFVSQFLIFGRF